MRYVRLVCFAVAALTLTACSAVSGSGGKAEVLISSKDYGFAVEFPATPTYSQTPATNGTLDRGTWEVDGEEGSLTVAAQQLRGAPPEAFAKTVLDAVVRDFEKRSSGEVISRTATTFLGGPAVDVVQKVDGAHARTRLVILGDRHYEIGVRANSGPPDSKDYEHLLSSFRRLPA